MQRVALFGITAVILCPRAAPACSCAPLVPICQRLAGASTAIVVMVTEGTETPGRASPFGDKAARVRVERVIRGLDTGAREMFVNPDVGTSCYSAMMPGERWLVMGMRLGGDALLTGGCSGSFRIREDDPLTHRIIESFFTGPNMVVGIVRRNTGLDTFWRKDNLIADAAIELSGPVAESMKTTPDGAFEFVGLPAGQYTVAARFQGLLAATRDGFREEADLKPFQVKEQGCVQIPVTMYANQSIRGVVRTPGGAPIGGLTIGLYRAERKVLFPMKEVKTDPAGAYEFSHIENGIYLVGTGANTGSGSSAKSSHEAATVVIHDNSAEGIDIIADPPRQVE